MSLGLGHRYWVRVIKVTYGTLEECIKFMEENKPSTKYSWFELTPQVKTNTKPISLKEYRCSLVEDSKW